MRPLLPAVAFVLFSACAPDVEYSGYVRGERSLYSFEVGFRNPSEAMRVSLVSSCSGTVGVRWYGPDGAGLLQSDTVAVHKGVNPYREGLVPALEGKWGVEVEPLESAVFDGFGLEIRRNGTR